MDCRVGTDGFSGQFTPHSSMPLFSPLLLAPLAAVTAAGSQADYRGTTRFILIPKAKFFFFHIFFPEFSTLFSAPDEVKTTSLNVPCILCPGPLSADVHFLGLHKCCFPDLHAPWYSPHIPLPKTHKYF